MSPADDSELDSYAYRLSVAWYFRNHTSHRLSDVRAGLADVLSGAGDARLIEAMRVAYRDQEALVYLWHMARQYAACGDPALAVAAEAIHRARGRLWDAGLTELGALE